MLNRTRELEGCNQSTSWREHPLEISDVLVVTTLFQGVAHYTFVGVASQR
jgi:hypothetical protein